MMTAAATPLKPGLDGVTPSLLRSLPWSPLDFISGISPAGDRALHIGPLVRGLGARDDLRFLCALPDGTELAVCAERLPWDSAFFGYDVAKLHGIFTVISVDLKQLGVDPELDPEVRLRLLRNVRILYAKTDARFDYYIDRVLEKYRHPLLLCLRVFRKVKVPFIFVRGSWRVWFSVASLTHRDPVNFVALPR